MDIHDDILQGSIQQRSILALGLSVVGGHGIRVHLSAPSALSVDGYFNRNDTLILFCELFSYLICLE